MNDTGLIPPPDSSFAAGGEENITRLMRVYDALSRMARNNALNSRMLADDAGYDRVKAVAIELDARALLNTIRHLCNHTFLTPEQAETDDVWCEYCAVKKSYVDEQNARVHRS